MKTHSRGTALAWHHTRVAPHSRGTVPKFSSGSIWYTTSGDGRRVPSSADAFTKLVKNVDVGERASLPDLARLYRTGVLMGTLTTDCTHDCRASRREYTPGKPGSAQPSP
jgi:hypothetical protein